jgi:hypothetical protein
MNKEDLEAYEEEVALKRAVDMFEGGTITKPGQSWRSSLLEAHINSLVGAPLSIIANIILLAWLLHEDYTTATVFAIGTWPIYLYLSVGRIYLFRRIFEKWGVHLEPLYIIRKIRNLL